MSIKYVAPNPAPKAVISVDNINSIYVYDIDYGINDSIRYRWVDGAANNKIRSARIRYTAAGDAYFISDGRRYYMNTAIRTF